LSKRQRNKIFLLFCAVHTLLTFEHTEGQFCISPANFSQKKFPTTPLKNAIQIFDYATVFLESFMPYSLEMAAKFFLILRHFFKYIPVFFIVKIH